MPTIDNTTVTEPHMMAAELYTMATKRCYISSSSFPEVHTMVTRRRIKEYDAFGLNHEYLAVNKHLTIFD